MLASNDGSARIASDAISLADGDTIYLSAWIRTQVGGSCRIIVRDTTNNISRATTDNEIEGTTWERAEATWTNSTGGAVNVSAWLENDAGDNTHYCDFDAVQLEEKTYVTTYCDGDQPGCEWNGAAHNSTSTRSALSRAGGVVADFEDLNFDIGGMVGAGMSPIQLNVDQYAILPGGELNSQKTLPRVFSLTGIITGTSLSNLHANRESLIEAVASNYAPGNQPLILRYTGASVDKEIAAYYQAGLEGNISADFECYEQRFALRFLAADPNWYEVGNSAAVLDSNDSDTLRYVAGRLRSTGQWDALGITNNPTVDGVAFSVLAAKVYDQSIYFGGMWDGINNNTPAGADNVVRYDPEDESWNVLVGASDITPGTGTVWVEVISEGPDGMIYLGGAFTAVNGVGTADYIVGYDPSTDTWFSLGDPDSGTASISSVKDMAWDSEGNLWIVGNFTNFANVANADYVAVWDGTAWDAPGSAATGGTGSTSAIAIDSQDNVYIGGNFTNWDGDGNADYWAWWDGSSWAAVNDIALVFAVYAMRIDDQDNLYVGGGFTDAGGVAEADYIFIWNGQTISALQTGMDDGVYNMRFAPDGLLWVTGQFTTAGPLDTLNGVAIWNGSSWLPPDVKLSGTPSLIRDIGFSRTDPLVTELYDTYIAFNSTGTCYLSGTADVTNDGTQNAYPLFEIHRSGGTSARLTQIRNETTGKTLSFQYDLLDGETLAIDLAPTNKSIISTFFGDRFRALLAGSDFGVWNLVPGTNQVTCFVEVAGAPTVTATIQWKDAYWSSD